MLLYHFLLYSNIPNEYKQFADKFFTAALIRNPQKKVMYNNTEKYTGLHSDQ